MKPDIAGNAEYLSARGWLCEALESTSGHDWFNPKMGPKRLRSWEAVKLQMDLEAKEKQGV